MPSGRRGLLCSSWRVWAPPVAAALQGGGRGHPHVPARASKRFPRAPPRAGARRHGRSRSSGHLPSPVCRKAHLPRARTRHTGPCSMVKGPIGYGLQPASRRRPRQHPCSFRGATRRDRAWVVRARPSGGPPPSLPGRGGGEAPQAGPTPFASFWGPGRVAAHRPVPTRPRLLGGHLRRVLGRLVVAGGTEQRRHGHAGCSGWLGAVRARRHRPDGGGLPRGMANSRGRLAAGVQPPSGPRGRGRLPCSFPR